MKEIVVISGKGGTGKTSITAALSYLAGDRAITADCDVDAADMHLLTEPDFANESDFYSGEQAFIHDDLCISCAKCYDVCRFDAVNYKDDIYSIDEINCEGCGYCARVCPTSAIEMKEQRVGKNYISTTRFGTPLVHAKLDFAAENSGKLVTKVKEESKKLAKELKKEFLLVDGSPGIGCAVVSSLAGADYVLLITEATKSGYHDLKRVYELVKKFRLKAGCIINKADLNQEVATEIADFLKSESIDHIMNLPYHNQFPKAINQGKNLIEFDDKSDIAEKLRESWTTIQKQLTIDD